MNLTGALAASAAPMRRDRTRGRTALVAGAVGRRGEALLNRVLGCGDYTEVVGLSQAPIAPAVSGLRLVGTEALPAIDDVFLLLSDTDAFGARSFHGRDAAFVAVDTTNCLAIARLAAEHGARRAVLLSPMPAWQQVGHFHRGLADGVELAVSQLPFESLTVLRPVREGRRAGAGLVERFVAAYLSLQLLMLPKSIEVMTSERLAQCALAAMRGARAGLQVHAADTMGRLLEQPA